MYQINDYHTGKRDTEKLFTSKDEAHKFLLSMNRQDMIDKKICSTLRYITETDDRACKRCGDALAQEDDLICGYHNLED